MSYKYKQINGKYVGYFAFEYDQAERTRDGEDSLQFITKAHPDDLDDCNEPPNGWADLEDALKSHISDIEYGADESLHIVDPCKSSKHLQTIETIREVLTNAGWIEIND